MATPEGEIVLDYDFVARMVKAQTAYLRAILADVGLDDAKQKYVLTRLDTIMAAWVKDN